MVGYGGRKISWQTAGRTPNKAVKDVDLFKKNNCEIIYFLWDIFVIERTDFLIFGWEVDGISAQGFLHACRFTLYVCSLQSPEA